jgi:uncharacterized protein with ATP-grasp and redox domains
MGDLERPPRIRTDAAHPFAHHTMATRVPAIFDRVLETNPELDPRRADAIRELALGLREGRALPPLTSNAPDGGFAAALSARRGERWLATDWFFAETYAYRQLVERSGFFLDGRDPFRPTKCEEYDSPAHAAALERALEVSGRGGDLAEVLHLALFGNRIDLSFAASLAHGLEIDASDLLIDDREAAIRVLRDGSGPVHVILDNAGTELSLDLVLVDALVETLGAAVVLHVKVHPTFVSDATEADLYAFLDETRFAPGTRASRALLRRLRTAMSSGALRVTSHWFWNGPESLWDLPRELETELATARLVISKGDANYRRAVGDAVWPETTPFTDVTASFPAPLLALRTLKSDPIVGLAEGAAPALDRADPAWRVNGRRGVASLGGRLVPR